MRWDSALEGVWLLRGSGRVLAVDGGRYAVLDDVATLSANGGRVWSERGRVRIGPVGRVELRPDGVSCPRSYRVRADYATLDARLTEESCGRLGRAADTWVRLL